MKKYTVTYSIQYQGYTIDDEVEGIEAYDEQEASDGVENRIFDNLIITSTAKEEKEEDDE